MFIQAKIAREVYQSIKGILHNNKNDNIHKSEVQDEQTNTDKYSCKYYRISQYIKINLPQTHYSKIHKEKAIISCKNVKWTYGLFGHNYRVAALSTLYFTVLGIIIPSLKSIGQFQDIPKWINQSSQKILCLKCTY